MPLPLDAIFVLAKFLTNDLYERSPTGYLSPFSQNSAHEFSYVAIVGGSSMVGAGFVGGSGSVVAVNVLAAIHSKSDPR